MASPAENGNKLANYPRIGTREELRALQHEFEITDPRLGFDVGGGNDVIDNYETVALYGWTASRAHRPQAPGTSRAIPFASTQTVFPPLVRRSGRGEGEDQAGEKEYPRCTQKRPGVRPAGLALCFHWSNPVFKDMLARLRAGLGIYWGVHPTNCRNTPTSCIARPKVEEFSSRSDPSVLALKAHLPQQQSLGSRMHGARHNDDERDLAQPAPVGTTATDLRA